MKIIIAHSFLGKFLLCIYYVSRTILGSGGYRTEQNRPKKQKQTKKNLALLKFTWE